MRKLKWAYIFCAVALYGLGAFVSAWYIDDLKSWLMGSAIQGFSVSWVIYELFFRRVKR